MHKQPAPFNFILLGDPASGKGTQAARLAKKYRLYNFDMGHEIRKPEVRRKYDYAKTSAIGKLTPTAVVRDILRRIIRTVPPEQGILFNGHPKMIGEARLVAKWLKQYGRRDPLVLYLEILPAEILRRTKKRVTYVGKKAVKRDDDNELALRNRRAYYRNQVSRVAAFFKKNYTLKKVSGTGNREEVAARIAVLVEAYRKKQSK